MGHVLTGKVAGYKSDVPLPSLPCLYLQEKPLVSPGARDFLNMDVTDKRIILLKRIHQRPETYGLKTATHVEFPLFLCQRDNLVVTGKKDVAFGLRVFFGFH